ncbi:MAG: PIN domain-containing protein [Acidobacteriia bacterium]|nr:PIN domain-containing protein [Terriglobia bacterium]
MKLAADANVLLAAVLGGRSRLILASPRVEQVFTAEPVLAEVREYTTVLARKKRLPEDLLLLAVTSLPVTIVEPAEYAGSVAEARRRIGRRDPDDVPILALALEFDIPVWSNDKDFQEASIPWFTTEDLLRKLGLLR